MDNTALETAAIIIKHFEGFRSKPYKCSAGVDTIGYGQTYYADGKRVTLKDKSIQEDEAEKLLMIEIKRIYSLLIQKFITVELPSNKMAAVIQFCYNLGMGRFQGSTLRKKINQNDFKAVPKEFIKWNKANGKALRGLTLRRNAEIQLWIADE